MKQILSFLYNFILANPWRAVALILLLIIAFYLLLSTPISWVKGRFGPRVDSISLTKDNPEEFQKAMEQQGEEFLNLYEGIQNNHFQQQELDSISLLLEQKADSIRNKHTQTTK